MLHRPGFQVGAPEFENDSAAAILDGAAQTIGGKHLGERVVGFEQCIVNPRAHRKQPRLRLHLPVWRDACAQEGAAVDDAGIRW